MTNCGMARLPTWRNNSAEATGSASTLTSVYAIPCVSRNCLAARQSRHQAAVYTCTFMPSFYCAGAATISCVTADEIKTLLNLSPHPIEGGSFRRTYTSTGSVKLARGARATGTAIYYLLESGTFSEMHVLESDELFHFYLGDPVEMLQLYPDGYTTRGLTRRP